jgi:putative CocE/NonD family hydrolase
VHLRSDNAYFDVFARLCDVSPDGRSANLTDQIFRSSPATVTPDEVWQVDIPLTDVAHVFRPGHRIRLQLSGGAHPRFSRNLGTDANPVNGTTTAAVTHHVQHSAACPSALILPVVAAPAAAEMVAPATQAAVRSAPAQ